MIHAKKGQKVTDIETLSQLPISVDLLLLKSRFRSHKNQTKKIFDLHQKGYLFLAARGRYLNLKSDQIKNICSEELANALVFPSYVTAEWALQKHGLLTERVQTITSVTPGRAKSYQTPLGHFTYEHLKKDRYPIGYTEMSFGKNRAWMALPEKALVDYLNLRIGAVSWKSPDEIEEFLREDLRLDVDKLLEDFSSQTVTELLPHYHRNSKEARVLKWLLGQKEK